MLIELCPGYWDKQLERMNMSVDEENGRAMERVRIKKVRQF